MAELKNCPSCGVRVDPDHVFCRRCGTDIQAAELGDEHLLKMDLPVETGSAPFALRRTGPRWTPFTKLMIVLMFLALLSPYFNNLYRQYRINRNQKEFESRQRVCLANLRVMQGAIEMWEMDQDVLFFGNSVDCEITRESKWGKAIVPEYTGTQKIPRCRMAGRYRFHATSRTVWCTRHNTVDSPMKGIQPAPGP